MRNILIIFVIISVSACAVYSQNKTIKGRIVSDQLEPISGVFIIINDTVEVGRTDINGFFQIDIPIDINKVLFKYVGLEPKKIELADECDNVEVIMMLNGTYDFMSLKEVDKVRLKRFNMLPQLHKKAFEKGLFKKKKACYIQEFIPYHKKK